MGTHALSDIFIYMRNHLPFPSRLAFLLFPLARVYIFSLQTPKHVAMAPSDDESVYLSIVHPYPLNARLELPADRRTFVL